jgi:thymidine phosphorylase
VQLLVEVGDRVEGGEPVARIHAGDRAGAEDAARRLAGLVVVGDAAGSVQPPATLLDVVRG